MEKQKNPAAVALGKLGAAKLTSEQRRRGGIAGGKGRAAALTKKRLRQIALAANRVRWQKYYEDHPQKAEARKRRDEHERKRAPAALAKLRAARLSPERRREIAQRAATTRWERERQRKAEAEQRGQ